MALNKYYSDELAYLRDLGAEFANENPNLAPFLARTSRDPDVERLLEGFAFLTGRLRQKIDDEIPELSHSLIGLFWPNYLRPIPAATIVEFTPEPGALTAPHHLDRGFAMETAPIDGTACQFQTCYNLEIIPARIIDAKAETTAATSRVTVTVGFDHGLSLAALGMPSLRFYLDYEREPAVAQELFLQLFNHLERCDVRDPGGDVRHRLPASAISPVGFLPGEEVIPYPMNSFSGYRLLQEYFLFPQKYMFFDVNLGSQTEITSNRIELVFEFRRSFNNTARLKRDLFRLNCTPAINIFKHDGQPIRVDHTKTEYRVRAAGQRANHFSIYSVDRVRGWVQGQNRRIDYQLFESFRHADGRAEEGVMYFRTNVQPATVGRGVDTYISFVDDKENLAIPPTQTVTLELTCTNGSLAERLGVGAINRPSGDTIPGVNFSNVGQITHQVPPPITGNLLWRLISNLALNFSSIASIDGLRTVLSNYNFRALVDDRERRRMELLLDSLREIRTKPIDWMVRGLPVRGLRVDLSVEESKQGGPGEAFLFGSVLSHYLQNFSSLNSCSQLTIKCLDSGMSFEWPVRIGQKSIL